MVGNGLVAAGAIILPNVGGFLSGIPVKNNMVWYEGLKKPNWRPPNWAFAPVWTTLYSSMGYASYLVWLHGGGCRGPAKIPLMVYGGHLALNWCWTPIFFGAHKLKLSLYEVALMDATAIASAYMFYQIKPLAGWMFLPTLIWLGLATAMTYVIVRDNPEEEGATITEIKDQ